MLLRTRVLRDVAPGPPVRHRWRRSPPGREPVRPGLVGVRGARDDRAHVAVRAGAQKRQGAAAGRVPSGHRRVPRPDGKALRFGWGRSPAPAREGRASCAGGQAGADPDRPVGPAPAAGAGARAGTQSGGRACPPVPDHRPARVPGAQINGRSMLAGAGSAAAAPAGRPDHGRRHARRGPDQQPTRLRGAQINGRSMPAGGGTQDQRPARLPGAQINGRSMPTRGPDQRPARVCRALRSTAAGGRLSGARGQRRGAQPWAGDEGSVGGPPGATQATAARAAAIWTGLPSPVGASSPWLSGSLST